MCMHVLHMRIRIADGPTKKKNCTLKLKHLKQEICQKGSERKQMRSSQTRGSNPKGNTELVILRELDVKHLFSMEMGSSLFEKHADICNIFSCMYLV